MPSPFFSLALLAAHSYLHIASASPDAWSRLRDPYPRDCSGTASPAEWAVYTSLDELAACDQTTRLDFSLYNPSRPVIRACSTSPDTQAAKGCSARCLQGVRG